MDKADPVPGVYIGADRVEMLPTATKFTALFERRAHAFVRDMANGGLVNQAQQHVMHEGRRTHIERADGTQTTSDLESVGHEIMILDAELTHFGFPQAIEKFSEIGKGMREGADKFFLRTLSEGLPESQKSNNSEPFSIETVFKALEMIWIDFDGKENPLDGLTWIVPPSMMPRIQQVIVDAENNPEIAKRLEELMTKKRMAYREAEADRRLVG